MSVSIIACPSCKALVLPDTAQCPNCQHVFDESRATVEPQPAAPESSDEDIPCPGCNELVRNGLVRCWNCGTFMRPEIAETYKKMQLSPPKITYSDLPDNEPTRFEEQPGTRSYASPEKDDFEGTFEFAEDESEHGDFDYGESEHPKHKDELFESAPVFQLREEPKTAEPGAKPAEAKAKGDDSQHEFSNEFESQFGDMHASGEGLMRVALAEEAEISGRRRAQKRGEGGRAGFRVFCPNGHRIEVQERHRGLTGRCPRCRETFVVPTGQWDEEQAAIDDEAAKTASIAASIKPKKSSTEHVEISAGEFTRWMLDCKLHTVNLTKLKLKPGSLAAEFIEVDAGFSPDGFLLASLAKKGGLLGGGDKKKLAAREAVIDHLSKGKGRDGLPAAAKFFFPVASIAQLRVVQPIVSAEQSMFAGVEVFGPGRIAVRLPKIDESAEPQFLSFSLSEFRRFAKILEEFYGIASFGADGGIPLEDVFTERYCHFSDQPLRILEHLEFYKADPGVNVELIGRKCSGCGLVMSETSREQQKIGGKNGKGIAKAKCPKCQKPMGDLQLFSLAGAAEAHA